MAKKAAIISILVVLIALYLTKDELLDYFEDKFFSDEPKKRMFTTASLSDYDGKSSEYLYLSLLGRVFDVSKGSKHYGPGSSYHFFVGKDATRSFVDGNFECKKDCDDVTGFTPQQLRSLDNWMKFYKKNYQHLGKLIGKYYKSDGSLTAYGKEIYKLIKKALKEETEEDRLKMRYPECNLEWDMDRGTHVWCSDQSGGIKRNWVGVPRKLFLPGAENHRCACVKEQEVDDGNVKEFDGCDPKSTDCYFK